MTKPSSIRFLIAYAITTRILCSYILLAGLKKLFGQDRMENWAVKTHRKNAQLLKKNILQLKGLFIKVGQMVSIMTNFLPEAYIQELEGLQDAVPPCSYEAIEQRIVDEFQKKPEEIFNKFATQPIASASLGQVHVAHLSDGTKLAVKVQYPGIEQTVKSDLVTLKRIFGLLNLFFPQYGLKNVYQEIKIVVLRELDFRFEVENLQTIANNFKDEPDFIFPKVYQKFSGQHILSLEFMEGCKISDHAALQNLGIAPHHVAEKILHAYCKQIFIDGIYHADPHPGNFLIRKNPTQPENFQIVFLDFGATAHISEKMRLGIQKFLEGVIRRDNRVISQALKDMGFISKTPNEDVFDRIVEYFYDRIKNIKIEDLKQIKFDISEIQKLEDVIEFKKMDISIKELLHTFNIPSDWAVLERALIVLFGLCTHLDPKINPAAIVLPYAETFVLGKDRSFQDLIAEALKEILLGYLKLPSTLEKTLKHLNQGEIKLKIAPDKKGTQILSRAIRQLTYTIIAMAGFTAHYFLKLNLDPNSDYPLYLAYVFSGLFILNFIKK